MIPRLADEDGFTIAELLVAMLVGTIVMLAALAIMDGSWRLQAKTVDSLDATDRGRLAMDRITQQLESRVCLSSAAADGSVVTATNDQIEFYASVTSDTAPRLVAERRRITYRPATSDILLETWRATAPPPAVPPANTATPTSSRIVATRVGRENSIPIFRYFALEGTPPVAPMPTLAKTAPIILAAARDSVVLVKVGFAALGRKPGVSTGFQNDSLTRSPSCLS